MLPPGEGMLGLCPGRGDQALCCRYTCRSCCCTRVRRTSISGRCGPLQHVALVQPEHWEASSPPCGPRGFVGSSAGPPESGVSSLELLVVRSSSSCNSSRCCAACCVYRPFCWRVWCSAKFPNVSWSSCTGATASSSSTSKAPGAGTGVCIPWDDRMSSVSAMLCWYRLLPEIRGPNGLGDASCSSLRCSGVCMGWKGGHATLEARLEDAWLGTSLLPGMRLAAASGSDAYGRGADITGLGTKGTSCGAAGEWAAAIGSGM
mmetsp:Transcript_53550/g.89095  ORF Transcript_53550/g.89095 Transcript_53550/m.89095 type:complete len:261 (+) Transcript_53550:528-1310(+)